MQIIKPNYYSYDSCQNETAIKLSNRQQTTSNLVITETPELGGRAQETRGKGTHGMKDA